MIVSSLSVRDLICLRYGLAGVQEDNMVICGWAPIKVLAKLTISGKGKGQGTYLYSCRWVGG